MPSRWSSYYMAAYKRRPHTTMAPAGPSLRTDTASRFSTPSNSGPTTQTSASTGSCPKTSGEAPERRFRLRRWPGQ